MSFKIKINISAICSSYGNANQEDLWTALGQQATLEGVVLPTTLNVIMNPWTYKMGYPYITITRNYQTGAATATQVFTDMELCLTR